MVDRFERFSYAITEISKNWHRLASDEMEKHGLKAPHSVYLIALSKSPDGMTSSALCEACARDKADVSRMMAIMEEKDLVVKKQGVHQNLYRGVFVLTEKGRNAADEVKLRAARAVELAGKDLTEENRAIFYDALDIITANLRKLSKDGIPE